MRNNPIVFPKFSGFSSAAVVALALAPWLGGCADGPSRVVLNRGYGELHAQNYDAADSDADEFLRAHPDGSGTAEAWYLKGRVDEAKAMDKNIAPTNPDKREWLERGKDAYTEGLTVGGPSGVRAQLHTGVANVDFHEEDYAGAMREWKAAYDDIPNEDNKAWVLYQIGRSQQRLGDFTAADKTFADVQHLYPGSDAAARAAMRVGMNAFYVEVEAYNDMDHAEKAAEKLRAEGLAASRKVDAGRQTVQVGPLPTYADARAVRSRLRNEYPGAIISP